MKKICPQCGIIFEVASDPAFCSVKCKNLFQQPGFFAAKGSAGLRAKSFWEDAQTEVFKGKGINPVQSDSSQPKFAKTEKKEIKAQETEDFEIIVAKKKN
ncbi:MAG: hypothetical protein ABH986_00535 [archaeon]